MKIFLSAPPAQFVFPPYIFRRVPGVGDAGGYSRFVHKYFIFSSNAIGVEPGRCETAFYSRSIGIAFF